MANSRGPAPGHGGRRPLLAIRPEVQDQIVNAVTAGNYLETAAEYAGVSRATLFEWLAKGRQAREAIDNQQDPGPNGEMYANFSDAVAQAQAGAEIQAVALVRRAALDSWQAAAWWLERSKPRRYGRWDRQEITGADGAALKIDLSTQREKALELLDEVAERLDGPEPA